jgi:outer membrane protein W
MRKATGVLTCLVIAAFCVWNDAWSADGKSVVRFGGTYVMPTVDLTVPSSFAGEDLGNGTMLAFDGTLTLEPQDTIAFTVGYEYRWSDLLGLDFTLLSATSDVDGRLQGTFWINDSNTGELISTGPLDETEGIGDVEFMPLMASVNFHLTPKATVDFYVAPVLAYVSYGDLDLLGEKVSLEDDFTYGAVIGLDVPAANTNWFFNGALRYLPSETKPDAADFTGNSLDVSPIMIQVAAGFRF